MEDLITYNGPAIRLGIDDLKSIYAFHGSSQGDTTQTNDLLEYQSSGGWLTKSSHFSDVDYKDQESINKRSLEINNENNKYIDLLKSCNRYGESTPGIKIKMDYYEPFDKPISTQGVTTSCRITYIELNN